MWLSVTVHNTRLKLSFCVWVIALSFGYQLHTILIQSKYFFYLPDEGDEDPLRLETWNSTNKLFNKT